MVTQVLKRIRIIIILCLGVWAIVAYISFWQWKSLYYCSDYNLFIYSDLGIVGNRTILLGKSLDKMNTLIRFDYTRDDNSCYILKGEEGFLIYWPEDTTSYHWDYVRDTLKNKYNLQKVPYQKRLKKMECQDGLFQLITYKHQTKENWIEDFESWTDSTNWDNAINVLALNNILIPEFHDWKTGQKTVVQKLSFLDCGITTYMKIYSNAIDKKVLGIMISIFVGLISILYFTNKKWQ